MHIFAYYVPPYGGFAQVAGGMIAPQPLNDRFLSVKYGIKDKVSSCVLALGALQGTGTLKIVIHAIYAASKITPRNRKIGCD